MSVPNLLENFLDYFFHATQFHLDFDAYAHIHRHMQSLAKELSRRLLYVDNSA
jgi:hypothetical protein